LSPSVRILADENVSLKLIRSLADKGFDIKHATKGLKNSELHSIALNEDRVLLTHDIDFSNTTLYPPASGTIILDVHPPELSRLKSALLKFFDEFSEERIKGKVFVVREGKIEILT